MVKHRKELSNQEKYIRKLRINKLIINICRIFLLVFILILWEVSANKGWIDSFIFSSPSRVIGCFISMLKTQDLLSHIGVTLKETLISFTLMIGIGLICSVILWRFKTVAKIFEPYLVVLNSLPKSALAPLMLVWLGANQKTIIVSGLSVGIFGAILSLYAGFLKVDEEQIKLIETLGGKKRHVLVKVMLPSTMPILISVMKVNIGLSLVGVVIGEFFAANKGLGYLIIYGSQVFRLDWVLMSICILCIIAMILYLLISAIEKRYAKRM